MSQPSEDDAEAAASFVEFFRAGSLLESDELARELNDAGIPTRVENELLQGGLGELPPGWNTLPRILVPEHCLIDARAVLVRVQAAATARGSHENCCLACNSPMKDVDTCQNCGWSWGANDEGVPAEPSGVASVSHRGGETSSSSSDESCEPCVEPSDEAASVGRSARELWVEVSVVMAVTVIPALEAAIQDLAEPQLPSYFWHAINLLTFSVCSIWIVVYIIRSNGESLSDFGFVRPQLADVIVGFLIVPLVDLTWIVYYDLIPLSVDIESSHQFALPSTAADYGLMVASQFANALHEELVLRAYLITRLCTLLKSRRRAVVVAATIFASYHIYQGAIAAGGIFLFGIGFGIMWLLFRRLWPLVIGHALGNIVIEAFDWWW